MFPTEIWSRIISFASPIEKDVLCFTHPLLGNLVEKVIRERYEPVVAEAKSEHANELSKVVRSTEFYELICKIVPSGCVFNMDSFLNAHASTIVTNTIGTRSGFNHDFAHCVVVTSFCLSGALQRYMDSGMTSWDFWLVGRKTRLMEFRKRMEHQRRMNEIEMERTKTQKKKSFPCCLL